MVDDKAPKSELRKRGTVAAEAASEGSKGTESAAPATATGSQQPRRQQRQQQQESLWDTVYEFLKTLAI
ncbi:hypothetical protein EC988_002459, partial [Linderina pennispora]